MLPSNARKYLMIALSGSPDVLERLLKDVPAGDPVWDLRPDPERFTLLEVLAHLADWDEVFLDRMVRSRDQNEPTLQGYDEGQIAIDRDYAHQDPHANIARFRANRAQVLDFLHGLEGAQWERIGRHTEVGPISIESHAVLIAGHDGNHLLQISQWLSAGGK